jgi:hypothetical protein
MRATAWLVVGCTLFGGCFREGLAPSDDVAAYPKPVEPGSALEQDIAAGYRAYREPLAPLGEWTGDAAYGVKWCPRGMDPATFAPYRSRGHWVAADAPDAPPSWRADDGAAWVDITTHHGWWVYDEPPHAPSRWCWVPGAEPTSARVVWRTGDGFVGWAPEPPPTDPDDPGDDDDLVWTFEFEGSLYDDSVDQAALTDSAADSAYAATRSSGAQRSRTGPPRSAVVAAHRALGDYLVAHPEVTKPSPEPLHASGERPRPAAMAVFERMRQDSELRTGSGGGALPRIPSETLHASRESHPSGANGVSAGHATSSSPLGYHPSGAGVTSHSGRTQVASNYGSGGGGGGSSFGGSGHGSTGHGSHGGGGTSGGGCGGSSAHSPSGHRK